MQCTHGGCEPLSPPSSLPKTTGDYVSNTVPKPAPPHDCETQPLPAVPAVRSFESTSPCQGQVVEGGGDSTGEKE